MTSSVLIFLAVLVGIAFIAVLWGAGIYNQLVTLKNRYQNAFSQIEVQLKRRYDLIPNLVETAKGYMAHERGTLEAVIAARNQSMAAAKLVSGDPSDADNMRKLMAAEGNMAAGLGRLMAVAESYPDLKANQNMMQFSEELSSTENRVAF